MNAIICDRCSKIQRCIKTTTHAEFMNREHIGVPSEFHLCTDCTEKFIQWVLSPENTEQEETD